MAKKVRKTVIIDVIDEDGGHNDMAIAIALDLFNENSEGTRLAWVDED